MSGRQEMFFGQADEEAAYHVLPLAHVGLDGSNGQLQELAIEWPCCTCNKLAVIQCQTCEKMFCNGGGDRAGACSHALGHFLTSNHRVANLYGSAAVLKCFACGGGNVFVLGFHPDKVLSDSVVTFYCRGPCTFNSSLEEVNWNWVPLVEGSKFSDWLVPSNESAVDQYLPLRFLLDNEQHAGQAVRPIELRYEDLSQYKEDFQHLVVLEAAYSKKKNDRRTQFDTKVRWHVKSTTGKVFAYFSVTNIDPDMRLMLGDEVVMSHKLADWHGKGHVIKMPNNYSAQVGIEMKDKDEVPLELTTDFTVHFVWKSTSFDRMLKALCKFKRGLVAESIYRQLLGIGDGNQVMEARQEIFNAPNLPGLNNSQSLAVQHALQRPLSLIQGPPGTGKTVTSASIVYNLVQAGQNRVLVTAPSNTAVDELVKKIHKTGLNVVRLCPSNREAISSPVSFLYLHNQILNEVHNGPDFVLYRDMKKVKDETTEFESKEAEFLFNRLFYQLKWNCEMELLCAADVLCTTCVGAADIRIGQFDIKAVLIDEAAQAPEPECLIPILADVNIKSGKVSSVTKVVLVGDQCQLGPVVMCEQAANAGLSQSLFDRLERIGIEPILLNRQYRMHPALSQFPSDTFYGGRIRNGVAAEERILHNSNFPWPVADKPMMFYCCEGQEERAGSGISFLNQVEASYVLNVIVRFLKSGIEPKQIGVITPYEGQRACLAGFLQRHGVPNGVEIASINAFQGREKDIIILSCVRSNEHQGIGFLNDPRRLNVALTRARFGLVIVGNAKMLYQATNRPVANAAANQDLWRRLVRFCAVNGLLVQGQLDDLEPCDIATDPLARLPRNEPIPLDQFRDMIVR